MHKNFWAMPLKIIFLFWAIALTLVSCQKATETKAPKAEKKILQFALVSKISTLDPANSYDTTSLSIVGQAYETLYQYHYLKRPYEIVPLLAQGMPKIEEGGTKYTIKIRPKIPYHSDDFLWGKQKRFVKAEDFITQIKRIAFVPTRSPGYFLFEDHIKGIKDFRARAGSELTKLETLSIEGLSAPDNHTLVIKLNHPYPQLINALSMAFTAPIPMEAVKKMENRLYDKMVGTGPFKLKVWSKLLKVDMVKNPDYAARGERYPDTGDVFAKKSGLLADAGKELPLSDGVSFTIMNESQTRWLNFKAGKIDIFSVPKDNFDTVVGAGGKLSSELKKKGISYMVAPTSIYWWISFNMRDPVLGKNKNLRMAVAHALHTDELIELFTNGIGIKANSIFPQEVPGYNPDHRLPYEFNLTRAKEYLAQAGFPGGKELPAFNFDMRGNGTSQRQMGEFFKKQLAQIGIKINVVTNSFPRFLEKARNGHLQFWHDGWGLDYPDAENILQLLRSSNHPPGPNSTYYDNPKYEKLYTQLKSLENGPKKFEIMKKMEALVEDDMPWVMLYYAQSPILIQPRLKNYRHSDIVANKLKYLRL